jgi:hypothetical protein
MLAPSAATVADGGSPAAVTNKVSADNIVMMSVVGPPATLGPSAGPGRTAGQSVSAASVRLPGPGRLIVTPAPFGIETTFVLGRPWPTWIRSRSIRSRAFD